MSYISKMKQEIRKDINTCEELLKKDYVEGKDFSDLVGKYLTKYPDFSNGLKNYAMSIGGKNPNQIENVRIIKSKLELLEVEIENPTLYQNNGRISNNTFNLNNSNTNINENYFNLSVQDVRKNIDENTYLGDNEKKELIQKLEEIEELQKSRESKNKKWEIAKGIFKFIIDKGADIAIMFIPQILKAIQS